MVMMMMMMVTMLIIMLYQRARTHVSQPLKLLNFSFLKAFSFLKYFKNILGPIFNSFNPFEVGHQRVGTQADDDDEGGWDTYL